MYQVVRPTLSAPTPENTTVTNFQHLPQKHQLAEGIQKTINELLRDKSLSLHHGTIVEAKIIHASSSTKNNEGKRDPEMHKTKKGNQGSSEQVAHQPKMGDFGRSKTHVFRR
ncbi:hypothetical protein SAMN05444352_11556 [Pseudomonas japonica]|uniref:Uncharacterized protein n=1 Tax=Pseudomonas japonica TaxID=256466 RepID=A0A239HEW7_9PSED|nr:hypothetical protein SAMN05444352_11556 [Pseudomonas japonica]